MPKSAIMMTIGLLTILVGTTSYVKSGPTQPLVKRSNQFDIRLAEKPNKTWNYLILTEVRRNKRDDSCDVFIAARNGSRVCNQGWIEAAEHLGMQLAEGHPRENSASYRVDALNFLGENGWDLVSVHKTETDWQAWVFKREIAPVGANR